MEHSWGHSPPNGTLREAKLCFSKKTWFPARCEGERGRGRKVLWVLIAPKPQPGRWHLPSPGLRLRTG